MAIVESAEAALKLIEGTVGETIIQRCTEAALAVDVVNKIGVTPENTRKVKDRVMSIGDQTQALKRAFIRIGEGKDIPIIRYPNGVEAIDLDAI